MRNGQVRGNPMILLSKEVAATAMRSIEMATCTSPESVRQYPRPLSLPTVSLLQRGAAEHRALVAERSTLYAAK